MRKIQFILLSCSLLIAIAGQLQAQVKPTSSDPANNFSTGVGIGPVYGGYGANLEYRIMPNYSATMGIGLDGENQWLIGGRYYLGPDASKTRARITLGYGEMETNNDIFSHKNEEHKVMLGIGWTNAKPSNHYRGWAIDITTQGTVNLGYTF